MGQGCRVLSQKKINHVSVALLLLGLGGAVIIYALAPSESPEDPWRTDPLGQRRYARQMQVMGGKANLLSADFVDWLGDRWHGRNLAGTVVTLTLVATGGYRFVAGRRLIHAATSASG